MADITREEAIKTMYEVFDDYFPFYGKEEADKVINVLSQPITNRDIIRMMFPNDNDTVDVIQNRMISDWLDKPYKRRGE